MKMSATQPPSQGRALGPPGRPEAGGGATCTTRGLRPRGRAEGPPLRGREGPLAIFNHRGATKTRRSNGAADERAHLYLFLQLADSRERRGRRERRVARA